MQLIIELAEAKIATRSAIAKMDRAVPRFRRSILQPKANIFSLLPTVVGFIDFHPFPLTSIIGGSLGAFESNGEAPHIESLPAMF